MKEYLVSENISQINVYEVKAENEDEAVYKLDMYLHNHNDYSEDV